MPSFLQVESCFFGLICSFEFSPYITLTVLQLIVERVEEQIERRVSAFVCFLDGNTKAEASATVTGFLRAVDPYCFGLVI